MINIEEKILSTGRLVQKADLVAPSVPSEGQINMYYGRIRSGKTYGATADAIEDVENGIVTYVTWPIFLDDFDDRLSLRYSLRNFLLFRTRYYRFPAENLHYIDAVHGEVDGFKMFDPADPNAYIKYLNSLSHCTLYIDEAWRVIDSYKGNTLSEGVRNLILVTGHQFRTVNLITQRPMSVHVTARGNINRFYKFVKVWSWPWVRFVRYEFQDMVGEMVDETQEPISMKGYWAKQKIFDAYDTHTYGNKVPLHGLNFEAFDLVFFDRLKLVCLHLFSYVLYFLVRIGWLKQANPNQDSP